MAALILLASFLDASAQSESASRRWTLSDARQAAFQNNWDLLASKSGLDAATAQLIVAREFPNPSLGLSSSQIDVSGHGNDTPAGNGIWSRTYDTIAAINQLIEIGGKRRDRRASARAGIESAKARFFDARRTLNQGVTKAYVAALLAGENARILKESARSLRHEADIADARFKAGDISDSDKKQIENNADSFELQAKSAEAAAVQARISVEILMGEPNPSGRWMPIDALDQIAANTPELHERDSGAERPDVFAAEADLKKSDADLKLQKAIRIPDPTFTVQVEHNPPGPPGPDTIGVGVSFPLPIWNQNGGAIKAAQATKDQSRIALEKVRAQAIADTVNAETSYQEASERFGRYQKQIQPKAGQVRESVAFAYEKGGASLVDLLTAERDNNTIRLATAQAMADTASAAADLEAARTVISLAEMDGEILARNSR